MILFLLLSTIYIGILLSLRPAPNSLRSKPLTFSQSYKAIKGTLFIGIFILIIFLITSDFSFLHIDEKMYSYLALNNVWAMSNRWSYQIFSHSFIHYNFLHIVMNISGLALMSVYERRVGVRRYFTVLVISIISSIPSIYFYSEPIMICGISGGIFGLAAAYFTDYGDHTLRDWLYAIVFFVFIFILYTMAGELQTNSSSDIPLKVDHLGHVFGAVGAITFCRLRPINSTNNSISIIL